jgi:NAD(P)-dependent dehydrogenase (short-subunit alcohol dehydrogenase family)
MTGKTALVTGSTSGLGEVLARRLGAMGAIVIVHGLDEDRGRQIAAEITKAGPGRAVYHAGDFSSLDQVRALAARIRANHPRLQLLINNAGIGGASNAVRRESADGNELVFQVNYLAPFLLTRELLPLLLSSAPARIVNVASIGQRPINFDDIMMQNDYQTVAAYSQLKRRGGSVCACLPRAGVGQGAIQGAGRDLRRQTGLLVAGFGGQGRVKADLGLRGCLHKAAYTN